MPSFRRLPVVLLAAALAASLAACATAPTPTPDAGPRFGDMALPEIAAALAADGWECDDPTATPDPSQALRPGAEDIVRTFVYLYCYEPKGKVSLTAWARRAGGELAGTDLEFDAVSSGDVPLTWAILETHLVRIVSLAIAEPGQAAVIAAVKSQVNGTGDVVTLSPSISLQLPTVRPPAMGPFPAGSAIHLRAPDLEQALTDMEWKTYPSPWPPVLPSPWPPEPTPPPGL